MNVRRIEPPNEVLLRWCPACGRDDRLGVLREHHYQNGKLCSGSPVQLRYIPEPPNPKEAS